MFFFFFFFFSEAVHPEDEGAQQGWFEGLGFDSIFLRAALGFTRFRSVTVCKGNKVAPLTDVAPQVPLKNPATKSTTSRCLI